MVLSVCSDVSVPMVSCVDDVKLTPYPAGTAADDVGGDYDNDYLKIERALQT
jgi:hypothetical protein